MSSDNTAERKTLLTTSANTHTISKKSKYCKWIAIVTILIVMIVITVILVVYLFERSSSTTITITPGLIGLWPTWGGNLQNQQIPPKSSNIQLTKTNIQNISILCTYESENGKAFAGYPTIDDNNNSFFADGSGYITSIDLDTCQANWRTHIGELLGYNDNIIVASIQSLTIYQDSNGNKGLLFGAPTNDRFDSNYPDASGCFAISVHLNNGSFWWKVTLGEDNNVHNWKCSSHGFTVDNKYAYGGFAQRATYNLNNNARFIGRYFKIDIDKHEIVDIWYPFPFNWTNNFDENNRTYNGISSYNFPAIIDDYVIFGTGNLIRTPTNIDQCLSSNESTVNFNNFLPMNESNYIDICGNNRSANRHWRCLQKDVYPDSLIILNKHTFKLEKGIPLQGCDVLYPGCRGNNPSPFCPSSPDVGFNADLVALAAYKHINGTSYVVGSQKATRLHIFEVPSGKLILSKKYGPAQLQSAQFGMAVHEQSMIGITSISGAYSNGDDVRYKLANNITVCKTGSMQAFNLSTGNLLWQIVNPYGFINHSLCFNDEIFDQYVDWTVYSDTNCNYGNFSNIYMDDNINIIIPPKWGNDSFLPLSIEERAKFRAPATIVNDMVFFGSDSGDIWIHDLYSGAFIHHFTCPNKQINDTQWNRPGVRGGISVVNDRVIFYCGGYFQAPDIAVNGNIFVSMKLYQ